MLIRLTPNAPVLSMEEMGDTHMANQAVRDTDMDAEIARNKRATARRKRSGTVVFKKISKGLYISHEHGMSLSHEAVWSRDVGRKWELTFQLRYLMLEPSKHSKKFDTVKEARAYANALVAGR